MDYMINALMVLTVAFVVAIFIYVSYKQGEVNKIKRDGFTVDAVVTKSVYIYRYYKTTVRFTTHTGVQHEASVSTRHRMKEGDKVEVAYLDDDYDNIAMVTEEPIFKWK